MNTETQIETFYPSEIVELDTLRPWPRNYKIHGDKQSGLLSQSLGDFGQPKNIVVWRGPGDDHDFIVAGHGLVEAANQRGWKRIEVKRLPSSWSLAQVEAYLIADNSLAELSETDPEKLATLLHAIRQENPRMLEPTSYDSASVDKMLKDLGNLGEPPPDAEPQIDRAEELRQQWQVEPGQMWRLPSRDGLGEHRLICGDCTDKSVVEMVMGGVKQICA